MHKNKNYGPTFHPVVWTVTPPLLTWVTNHHIAVDIELQWQTGKSQILHSGGITTKKEIYLLSQVVLVLSKGKHVDLKALYVGWIRHSGIFPHRMEDDLIWVNWVWTAVEHKIHKQWPNSNNPSKSTSFKFLFTHLWSDSIGAGIFCPCRPWPSRSPAPVTLSDWSISGAPLQNTTAVAGTLRRGSGRSHEMHCRIHLSYKVRDHVGKQPRCMGTSFFT